MIDLPRSARLAAWGTAVLRGEAPVGTAVRAVQRDDEPHTAAGDAPAADLAELLEGWRAAGHRGLRVVLPVPGDVSGLPGPASFNVEALDVGEAVLTDDEDGAGRRWGAWPDVTEFGSALEPGAMVAWHAELVQRPTAPPSTTLADAERQLSRALEDALGALHRLDVARWREDAATRIALVRDGALPRDAVPPSTPPRAQRVLATAARLRGIVALASEDDGAAVTGFEAAGRSDALRGVEAVARHAVVAAVNAGLEPVRPG
ncbi:hypothetical protein WDV85_08880 [Pseudokineococcus sp. 5B2Z-1]|uniref:hypothetical protein n=1 Tax=Pseudokineococcus sp. 5B2Z-1 TaxID=3132744 RepID=UPI0030A1C70E